MLGCSNLLRRKRGSPAQPRLMYRDATRGCAANGKHFMAILQIAGSDWSPPGITTTILVAFCSCVMSTSVALSSNSNPIDAQITTYTPCCTYILSVVSPISCFHNDRRVKDKVLKSLEEHLEYSNCIRIHIDVHRMWFLVNWSYLNRIAFTGTINNERRLFAK